MRLRTATRADHDDVVAAIRAWWGGRDLTGLMQPLFLQNFASTSLIAEDDEGMAGFLVGFRSADDPAEAYVHFVGVRPDQRGTGLGRRLYAEFAARMSGSGVRAIRCVTSPVNTASVAFHRAVGFEVEGTDDAYVRMRWTLPPPSAPVRPDPRPQDTAWPTAVWPVPAGTVLAAAGVTLTPATTDDAEALFAALDDDDVWRHVRGRPASPSAMVESLATAEATGRFPWTVRRGGEVVGTTSYLEVSPVDARLEIGFTLYARRVWASEVNPACKLLLLEWAFEVGRMGRVQLKTDIRNARSQAAIERLGATYEGVLRRYQRRADGSVRDTVLYSITAEDWPRVRRGLAERLAGVSEPDPRG